jgi:GntR family transcriptional regulator/MocR family aminotransferase
VDFQINLVGRKDLSAEIYRQLRAAIWDGRVRPGDRLPPSRQLAGRLSVARMTVTVAYERLASEGYLTSRVGAGTFVKPTLQAGRAGTGRIATAGPLRARRIWDGIESSLSDPPFARTPRFDFRSGLPDAALFPHRTWRRLISRQFQADVVGKGIYGEPSGHRGLREAIARHIVISRGVETSPDDLTVTTGTLQAIDIVSRLLLVPGDRVAVETPGYKPVNLLLSSSGMRVLGVPVDEEGLVVEKIPSGVRLVYVTPSHQYPLGVSMSLQRRLALVAWAENHDAAIIEDDYDSEFRFRDRPIEPIHALGPGGRVIYVSSFSKTMLPTLRIGFVVTPSSLRGAVRAAKFLADWHNPLATQAALAQFIDEGHFARHIRRMRATYGERHDLIGKLLVRDFARFLTPIRSIAGLHLTALSRGLSSEAIKDVVMAASNRGVEIQELSRFSVDGVTTPAGVVLGYGAIPTGRITEGMRILEQCFRTSHRPVLG